MNRTRLAVTLLSIASVGAGCASPPASLTTPGRSAASLSGGPNASLTFAARTGAGVALVDLGWWGYGRGLHRMLRTLDATPSDVRHVFLTHAHRDHLAAWRHVRQATFYVAGSEYARLVGVERPRGWIPRVAEWVNPARYPRAGALAIVTFSRDTTFVLGADTVRAYLVPGHTPGSTVYLLRGTLFLGDVVTYTRRGGFSPAKRGFSDDTQLAAANLSQLWERLPAGAVRHACTAHARCAAFTPEFLADIAR